MANESTCPPLTRASVEEAHRLVAPHVHRTPVVTSRTVSEAASQARSGAAPRMRLWFKCENMQRGGAFKARGAFHALVRLQDEEGWERDKGVATHSSGNHAQALALAARAFSIPAHIVMPHNSVPAKIAATRSYGAHVSFSGPTSTERDAAAARVVAATGARLVPPYDHPDIILGQGTLGLEMQAQVREMTRGGRSPYASVPLSNYEPPSSLADQPPPSSLYLSNCKPSSSPPINNSSTPTINSPTTLDAVIAPCGGGGMLSGLALSFASTPTRIFGAEPSLHGADDARRGLHARSRVPSVPATATIADGLRTPLGLHPWSVISHAVEDIYAVSEDHIRAAMRLLFERCKLVVEPSAAVGLAVVLFDPEFRALVEREGGQAGWDVGVVLSGGNVDLDILGDMLAQAPRL